MDKKTKIPTKIFQSLFIFGIILISGCFNLGVEKQNEISNDNTVIEKQNSFDKEDTTIIKKQTISDCENMGGVYSRDDCYLNIGIAEQNLSICDKIQFGFDKGICYDSIAVAKGDISLILLFLNERS